VNVSFPSTLLLVFRGAAVELSVHHVPTATNRSRDIVERPAIIAIALSEGCSQVVTKRATKNYVAYGRVASRAAAATLGFVLVAACSNSDYVGSVTPTVAATPAPAAVQTSAASVPPYGTPAFGAPVTAADGYPNINVDTARRPTGPMRSAADQDKLEAELLALGARQRSSNEAAPGSVIQELQDLGRRSRAEAEQQIESGAAPKAP